MRALAVGLSLGLFLFAVGCASSGVSCVDKGGICNAGAVCPSGTEQVTPAQLEAAGTQSTAYSCPAQGAVDAGLNVPICCLPIPASN